MCVSESVCQLIVWADRAQQGKATYIIIFGLHICSSTQENLEHLDLTVHGCVHQRSPALKIDFSCSTKTSIFFIRKPIFLERKEKKSFFKLHPHPWLRCWQNCQAKRSMLALVLLLLPTWGWFYPDWLVDWLIGWLIDWLIGWLIDWLVDWMDWWIGGLMDWFSTSTMTITQ